MFYGKVAAMLVWQFLAIRQIGCDVHYYLSLFALKSKLIEIIELEEGLSFRHFLRHVDWPNIVNYKLVHRFPKNVIAIGKLQIMVLNINFNIYDCQEDDIPGFELLYNAPGLQEYGNNQHCTNKLDWMCLVHMNRTLLPWKDLILHFDSMSCGPLAT